MNIYEAVKYKNDSPDKVVYRYGNGLSHKKLYLEIIKDEILSGDYPLDVNDFYSEWYIETKE